ncbi:MAG: D-inositol 3-phosphate glycosyltransferase [Elusimicrobia bacterium ADurb.Bin231]|nr:MAG: D-inositol 3-phosphate glycosyltransferase [Elusimicrobia bacterium ADurb.Bin231]
MNIAIDINGAFSGTGLSNYIISLINSIAKIDGENKYFLFAHSWKDHRKDPAWLNLPRGQNFNLVYKHLPEVPVLWAEYALGVRITERILSSYGIDVFHGTGNIIPRLRSIASVLTVHHYKGFPGGVVPDSFSPKEKFYFKCTDDSVNNADYIITDSEHTKKDIKENLKIKDESISTVYAGLSDIFHIYDSEFKSLIKKKYDLPDKFIFVSGPINERKNLLRLLEAFAALRHNFTDLELVISGDTDGNYFANLISRIISLKLENYVHFIGFVPGLDMPGVYGLAQMLVYPSLYEGFGFPPLEAMACGCPVAASNVSSIPEVVGDAGLLFNPYDTGEILSAVEKLLKDAGLRTRLISNGLDRSSGFTWMRTAKKTIEIYRKAYEGLKK